MAKKQIKQEIVLDGEKQYNAAIKEAQRNLKTLQTAMKAETAELGKNATAQQKNEVKVKSLKEQIKEQEKIVQTLRDALEKAREEYGDNADVVQKWEQKLNLARASLAGMKNDLEGVGDGLQTVKTDAAAATVATKSVADALGSIGDAGESVSSAIEDIFTGMIDTVTGAVEALWDMISETAAKANNWTDIAGYWGTDAQTIQQYARAVSASANSFDDLQAAVSKIVMGGKGEDIAELLGISDVNYKNDWAYAMAVMDRLQQLTAEGQDMTPIYEQIFGERKSTKVMDLVNDWKTIQELLPQFNGNESGYGMSDKELSVMNDLWVEINKIEDKWEGIKENIAGGFGVVSMDLLVNVEGTLDGIADYLNAKDEAGKQAALDKIRANVEEFFTKLGEIIRDCIGILREVGGDLQGSDDPLTSAIGDILVKLADALQWMVDNADKVKAAFETIFGVWLLAKLAAVAGKLSSILMQIEAIKAFKGIGLGGSGAGGGDAATGAGGGGILTGIKNAATGMAAKVAGTVSTAGLANAGFVADWFMHNTNTGRAINPEYGGSFSLENLMNGFWQTVNEWAEDQVKYGQEVNAFDMLFGNGRQRLEQEAQEQEAREYYHEKHSQGDAPTEEQIEDAQRRWSEMSEIERKIYMQQHPLPTQQDMDREWLNDHTFWSDGSGSSPAEQVADEVGDAADRVIQKLDEKLDESGSLPDDWYTTMTGAAGAGASGANENGITSSDLQRFNGLPAGILSAVKAGARDGVSGIRVSLDGRTVGQLVAPYVSEAIARDIVQ